jgi:hypothetical protein
MIKELQGLHDPWRKCVRVTGTVQSVDIHRKVCLIYHQGKSVLVDISLVDPSIPRLDTLCQFIGEIRQLNQVRIAIRSFSPLPHQRGTGCLYQQTPEAPEQIGGMLIAATIARNVDGLDLDLFEQALLARREFLQVYHQCASCSWYCAHHVSIASLSVQATSPAAASSSST